MGDLKVELPNGDQKSTPITLKNVYYSPHMAFTLMSVSCVDKAGFSLYIKGGGCIIRSANSNIIGRIPLVRGLNRVGGVFNPLPTPVANLASKLMSISELHRKMGHINHDDLRRMVKEGMVKGVELDYNSKPEFCEACIKAKADRKPFPKESKTVYEKYGDKVVGDLWGPARVESLGGKKYYFLLQDLSSHEEKVYFERAKSEALNDYKKYKVWASVQCGMQIKIFGCDRSGEFMSKEFTNHLENAGTIRHLTVHDSPASNGAVERGNRTHMNDAHAMMIAAGLPRSLWAEAVHHNVWLCNRTPTRALTGLKTPFEVATGKKPDLLQLCEWGAIVWVKCLDAGKLDPRAEEARFVGFDDESKGYRIYWPKKFRISIERDVYFDKDRALQPDEVPIEGVEDVFDNLDIPQSSNTFEPAKTTLDVPTDNPEPKNIENLLKTPTITPDTLETQNTPVHPPHQMVTR
jgi:hypothetical protein